MTRRSARTERDVLRRILSQNFLRGSQAISVFLDALTLDPNQLCIEVGAGDGALTKPLAERCPRLVAYEIDHHMAERLRARLGPHANVTIVVGDFLASTPPDEPFQVVGNVPFSITSAVVDWCLAAPTLTSATIITQAEYAKKRTGGYGRWSLRTVLTWPEFTWEMLATIDRTQFRPVPRVDAAVLRIARRPRPLIPRHLLAPYHRIVRLGFTGVGGSVYASLAREFPAGRVARACQEAGVDRSTIVAYVTPEQWLQLFAALHPPQWSASGGRRERPEKRGRRPAGRPR